MILHFIFTLDESTRKGLVAENHGSQLLLCFFAVRKRSLPQGSILILPVVFTSFVNSQHLATELGGIWMSFHQEGHLNCAGLTAYLGIYPWPS